MKKKITCLVLALIMCMSFGTSAIGMEYQEMGSLAGNLNLYEDLVRDTFSPDDVRALLAVQNARTAPASNELQTYTITDADIEKFYDDVSAIAASSSLEDYFSRSFWQFRYNDYYGEEIVSLTLTPTEYMKSHTQAEEVAAVWVLVKARHGHSQYWENEVSLERQFSCHAMGEQWLAGDVGDWDLEPIRPAVGLALVIAAECNPV